MYFVLNDQNDQSLGLISAIDMSAWRMRPPAIRSRRPDCWAAAISSWSRVTSKIPQMTTAQIVEMIRRKYPNVVDANGSLEGEAGIRAIAEHFGFKLDIIQGMVTSDFLVPKLRRSHVLLVHQMSADDTLWHTVLCYGVDRSRLCFMDPLEGRRFCIRQYEFGSGHDVKVALWL